LVVFKDRTGIIDCLENALGQRKLLVIGDIMLDRYLWGTVSRISPEAPVPVVKLIRQTETAGGAGNVALNAAGLGMQVAVCAYAGTDLEGDRLIKLLADSGVETGGIVRTEKSTITKTRVIGGPRHQQMLRLDTEDTSVPARREVQSLLGTIEAEMDTGVGAVIISDYAKGTLTKDLCRRIIGMADERGIPALVDPKGHDYSRYAGATAISPNRAELAEVSRVQVGDLDGLMSAGQHLCRELGLQFILLTLSELGMALIGPDTVKRIPAVGREVFDVSGAGDTAIATLAAGIASGLDLEDAVSLANLAAGVVVEKVGTTPVTQRELIAAISTEQAIEQSDKVCALEDLLARAAQWKAKGERIAFTNGCFDLLHVGHVTYLESARREGDRLIIGLNTDRSVRALKGKGRPVIPQDERARVLAALASVDAVILFDDDTPLELIKAIRPDVLVKGNDYREEDVAGAKEVRSWGGNVVLVPLVAGRSTSNILKGVASGKGNENNGQMV
jgi:D-beta-D-heptose 7-phosphate kinase / D-beta-D-heptose 1-phosphate adenosyltransferase